MSDVLKGNFQPKISVTIEKKKDSTEDMFERKAMQRLGGSICFVAKKKVKWDVDE